MATILKRTFKAKIQAALEQVPEDRLEKWLETEFSDKLNMGLEDDHRTKVETFWQQLNDLKPIKIEGDPDVILRDIRNGDVA